MRPVHQPYISFVAASRNDNHGGDMHKRMRIFVRGLMHQCNKFKLPAELIIVEWNPPSDKPLLKDILPNATKSDLLIIRYIVVPEEVHREHAFHEQIPLFQMIAKNVGIQRANGKFVICTNVDLLFSDALFEKLAQQNLNENCFYRANRCDVPNSIEENITLEEQLDFCKKNILKRLGKNALYPNFIDTRGALFKFRIAIPFLIMLSKIKALYAKSPDDLITELDLDACGDFTMMSKQNWLNIQGYPELEIYSIHIDSMGVLAAAAEGIKQVVFDTAACTYHLEHTGGWEFKTPLDRIHFYTKKPMLEWWAVREAGLYIITNKTKFNLNKQNWGLKNLHLQEIPG